MPTIQVRTDDQTKNASTALFEKLGITMSEAINLFLRQSIMRGGIPFTLTVPETHKTNVEIVGSEALVDAISRYKSVNGKNDFEIAQAEPFFRVVKNLIADDPDNVFILTQKNGKLFVKDCNLNSISETLGGS